MKSLILIVSIFGISSLLSADNTAQASSETATPRARTVLAPGLERNYTELLRLLTLKAEIAKNERDSEDFTQRYDTVFASYNSLILSIARDYKKEDIGLLIKSINDKEASDPEKNEDLKGIKMSVMRDLQSAQSKDILHTDSMHIIYEQRASTMWHTK